MRVRWRTFGRSWRAFVGRRSEAVQAFEYAYQANERVGLPVRAMFSLNEFSLSLPESGDPKERIRGEVMQRQVGVRCHALGLSIQATAPSHALGSASQV